MQKITFDTLAYSKKLSEANVINSDVFTEALTEVLKQTTYNTYEVDMAIEQILKDANLRFEKSQEKFRQELAHMDREFLEQINDLKQRIERSFARNLITSITIMATVTTIVTTVITTIGGILLHFSFVH